MDKELLKQIGAVIIVIIIGWMGVLLIGLGTLEISAGLLFALGVSIVGIFLILYFLISFFTGAKISDVKLLGELVQKLLDIFSKPETYNINNTTLSKEDLKLIADALGDKLSDSTENTTS